MLAAGEAAKREVRGDPAARARARDFISKHLRLSAVPGLQDILLYTAHPASGLGRYKEVHPAPYWAYAWAGGLALARHLRISPGAVAGKTVVDIGSGSGLVAIAAAQAGAAHVVAIEDDIYGAAATSLNAEANGVRVDVRHADAFAMELSQADIVLAGDVFYNVDVARQMTPLLAGLAARGMQVLIGDPGRRHLPLTSITLVAEYEVQDVGGGMWPGGVYVFSG